ncbi:hypothetical protein IWW36_003436 [Coemansia brasiliensis]|uniref:Uncharacterized protein n=1 Tax=Coemansia brasiliensis TaxID=2650707 RepID=A0A9W8I5D1_9FUNG|nr:hypothetical protein IWW36_003436 [Coemansia brasiliensis]
MPPRRTKSKEPPPKNATLDKFFNIERLQPVKPMQPTLKFFLNKKNSALGMESSIKPDYVIKSDIKHDNDGNDSDGSKYSSNVGSVSLPVDTSATIALSESDSDNELVDVSGLLGTSEPNQPQKFHPRTMTPQTTSNTSSKAPSSTPYKNSLKSLVQSTRRQKYNLSYLEKHLGQQSSDEEDKSEAELDNYDTVVNMALNEFPEADRERVRTQLEKTRDILRKPTRLSLFKLENYSACGLARLPYGDGRFDGIIFSTSDSVERLCGSHIGEPHFFRQLVGSSWIKAQAYCGWRLTQSIGDVLLRVACLEDDDQIAATALDTLHLFQELQLSLWKIQLSTLLALVNELQGGLRDRAEEEANVSDDGDSSISGSSLPSVYVEVTVPGAMSIARANAERVTYLLEIASKALEFMSVPDSCQVLLIFIASLLDHRNQLYSTRIQQALVTLVDKISPPSKWMLIWPECIARLGKLSLHLSLHTQLHIVDCLPVSNKRCMQIRHSLSFLFLRFRSTDFIMADKSVSSLATSAILPSQIILRMVSEMMDPSESLFRVDSHTNFIEFEAAVGLLSNVLDNTQAMQGVREETKAIHQRLHSISKRINEGMADRLDKTLAKDAIQTLLVRLFMTALSDAHERLEPVHTSRGASSLDSWLSKSMLI